jgi:NAD(P)H-nitrite reductase large subunit
VKTKYLIVGSSAGGIGAAEAIREVDRTGSLTMISDEPYPSYSRPLISKYLARERTLDGMLYRPPDFCESNSIDCRLGTGAKTIDLDSRAVDLESGERISWEKLLVASGGKPVMPAMEGGARRGVFTFLTLDDAKAIDQFLEKASKAVVIGGGLIGLSVTEALIKRGVEVLIVEMKDRVLNTIVDEQTSSIAGDALAQAGVRIIAGHTVAEISGKEWVTGVVLDDGTKLDCSLVVVAIGVTPRTELVQGTGIEVNRGIVVDRNMRTSHPGVYACGDVAEAFDFILRENRLTPVWPNAYIGGRVAGFNMAGVATEYPGGTALNSLSYFGVDIASAGMTVAPDDGYESLSRRDDGVYKKLVLQNDVIVGMVCVGDIERSGIIFSLMRDGVNVSDFKQALLADDFGLVSLPRSLWQERLGVSTKERPERGGRST